MLKMLQGHGHRCVSVSEFVDLGPAGLGLASHQLPSVQSGRHKEADGRRIADGHQ